MANKNTPIGGRIRSALHTAKFNSRSRKYIIPASDSNEYFINDFVSTNETSEAGIPIVVKSAAGEPIRGIITGFIKETPNDSAVYRPANRRVVALVCDDPLVEFEIQVTGTVVETDIGKAGDILVASGNPVIGVSETQLDRSTISSTALRQLKILSIIDDEQTTLGTFTNVMAMIWLHELVSSVDTHNLLLNLAYDDAGHGSGKTGFQRGTTEETRDPINTDDDTEGYVPGDFWLNTSNSKAYMCLDNTTSSAVWRNIDGGEDQEQVYYFGKGGSDSDTGLTINSRFLTLPKTIAAMTAYGPTSTSQVVGVCVDDGTYAVNGDVQPSFSKIDMQNAILSGFLVMNGVTSLHFKKHITPNTGVAIQCPSGSAGARHIKGELTEPGINSTYLQALGNAQVYVHIDNLDMNNTGSTVCAAAGTNTIFFNNDIFIEAVGSSCGLPTQTFYNVRAKEFNGFTYVSNPISPIEFRANDTRTVIMEDGNVEYPNMHLFGAQLSTTVNNVTGGPAGPTYKIPFDVTSVNINGCYSTSTYRFTTDVEAWCEFVVTVYLTNIALAVTDYEIRLHFRDDVGATWGNVVLEKLNPGAIRGSGNVLYKTVPYGINLPANYTAEVEIEARNNATAQCGVGSGSTFTGRVVRKTA